jgi:hypothetical protein
MVNTGFHSHRMVSNWWIARRTAATRMRRKSKIYRTIDPEEFCVNFPRIKLKAITCDLSRVARSDYLREIAAGGI